MGVGFCCGPDVGGAISIDATNEDWETVVLRVIGESELDFQLVDSRSLGLTLVVSSPSKLQELSDDLRDSVWCFESTDLPKDSVRAEFLLEEELAARVIDFLANEYPRVRFDPHPIMNGFFATGSRDDLELIREEVKRINDFPASPYLLP